MSKSAKTIN